MIKTFASYQDSINMSDSTVVYDLNVLDAVVKHSSVYKVQMVLCNQTSKLKPLPQKIHSVHSI